MTATAITFERIRERAYELWERHHRPAGFEMEFWVLAERELKAERDRQQARADEQGDEPESGAS